jgi:pyrroline-5-carboxylate reductase
MSSPVEHARQPIAFIGGGNMASALIGGLLRNGWSAESVLAVEPQPSQRQSLSERFGVTCLAEAGTALAVAGTVVWAVKPQGFREAAAACAPYVAQALQLSVMAGIRSDAITKALGTDRVVRSMPNTPALIGEGISGLYARPAVSSSEHVQVEALLAPTGQLLWVDDETLLDAVTALSGSGPAYVFYVLEALIESGVSMGLTPEAARQLALATFSGATSLARQSDDPPAVLRERVTSKGGTTFAALTSLEADAVKPAFLRALKAAQQRADELGDEFGA